MQMKLKLANSHAAGPLDCVKKTLQWEGVGGLYKVHLSSLQQISWLALRARLKMS